MFAEFKELVVFAVLFVVLLGAFGLIGQDVLSEGLSALDVRGPESDKVAVPPPD